jgi:hypothetical protein
VQTLFEAMTLTKYPRPGRVEAGAGGRHRRRLGRLGLVCHPHLANLLVAQERIGWLVHDFFHSRSIDLHEGFLGILPRHLEVELACLFRARLTQEGGIGFATGRIDGFLVEVQGHVWAAALAGAKSLTVASLGCCRGRRGRGGRSGEGRSLVEQHRDGEDGGKTSEENAGWLHGPLS